MSHAGVTKAPWGGGLAATAGVFPPRGHARYWKVRLLVPSGTAGGLSVMWSFSGGGGPPAAGPGLELVRGPMTSPRSLGWRSWDPMAASPTPLSLCGSGFAVGRRQGDEPCAGAKGKGALRRPPGRVPGVVHTADHSCAALWLAGCRRPRPAGATSRGSGAAGEEVSAPVGPAASRSPGAQRVRAPFAGRSPGKAGGGGVTPRQSLSPRAGQTGLTAARSGTVSCVTGGCPGGRPAAADHCCPGLPCVTFCPVLRGPHVPEDQQVPAVT